MKCTTKKQFECVYLTKQNRDEFLKKFEPDIGTVWKSIKEDNDKYFIVEAPLYKTVYYYNNWYVTGMSYMWERYTNEDYYELLDKIKTLEKENERLQDENCFLDSENDMLRSKIEHLEDMLNE